MQRAKIRLVSLDSTGTLLRVRGSLGKHYTEPLRRRGINISRDVENSVFKNFFKAFKQMSATSPNFGAGRETASEWWRSLVKLTYDYSSIQINDSINMNDIGDELYERFKREDAWDTFNEVEDVIEQIRGFDCKIVVLSNFDERLVRSPRKNSKAEKHAILDRKGLAAKVDRIFLSTDLGVEKPDGRIFNAVSTACNIHPFESIHVGDHAEKDYLGAIASGWNSLLLDRTGEFRREATSPAIQAGHLISDLRGLVEHLKQSNR